MTLALGLLVASFVIATVGPLYLRTTVTPRVRPRLALAGWVSSMVLTIASALAAAVLLVSPRSPRLDGLIGMANSCVNVVRPGGEIVWEHIARLAGAVLVFGIFGWTFVISIGAIRRHYRWRGEHLALLHAVCRAEKSVLWVDQEAPIAYSVGGRRGAVVATSGVADLDTTQRVAILAHERAHLLGRHHIIVLATEIMASALPFVPLFRSAPSAVKMLVELAADATAARSCGKTSVRSALLRLTSDGAPSAALAMSRDAVEARLRWLGDDDAAPRWLPARADYAAGALLSIAPALVSVALVAAALLFYCVSVSSP